jgi:hypothetical protein
VSNLVSGLAGQVFFAAVGAADLAETAVVPRHNAATTALATMATAFRWFFMFPLLVLWSMSRDGQRTDL